MATFTTAFCQTLSLHPSASLSLTLGHLLSFFIHKHSHTHSLFLLDTFLSYEAFLSPCFHGFLCTNISSFIGLFVIYLFCSLKVILHFSYSALSSSVSSFALGSLSLSLFPPPPLFFVSRSLPFPARVQQGHRNLPLNKDSLRKQAGALQRAVYSTTYLTTAEPELRLTCFQFVI